MKIRIDNLIALEVALNEAQEGARVRKITVKEIQSVVYGLEGSLRKVGALTEVREAGIHFFYRGEAVPNSYKYTAKTTQFEVFFTRSGAYVCNVLRGYADKRRFGVNPAWTAYGVENGSKVGHKIRLLDIYTMPNW